MNCCCGKRISFDGWSRLASTETAHIIIINVQPRYWNVSDFNQLPCLLSFTSSFLLLNPPQSEFSVLLFSWPSQQCSFLLGLTQFFVASLISKIKCFHNSSKICRRRHKNVLCLFAKLLVDVSCYVLGWNYQIRDSTNLAYTSRGYNLLPSFCNKQIQHWKWYNTLIYFEFNWILLARQSWSTYMLTFI